MRAVQQLLFALQVLAQLHGAPAEEGEEDEQQEDVQPGTRGQEHRRPKSGGNLEASSSNTVPHKIGRPPLAETTANNKLGLKVGGRSCSYCIKQAVHVLSDHFLYSNSGIACCFTFTPASTKKTCFAQVALICCCIIAA